MRAVSSPGVSQGHDLPYFAVAARGCLARHPSRSDLLLRAFANPDRRRLCRLARALSHDRGGAGRHGEFSSSRDWWLVRWAPSLPVTLWDEDGYEELRSVSSGLPGKPPPWDVLPIVLTNRAITHISPVSLRPPRRSSKRSRCHEATESRFPGIRRGNHYGSRRRATLIDASCGRQWTAERAEPCKWIQAGEGDSLNPWADTRTHGPPPRRPMRTRCSTQRGS